MSNDTIHEISLTVSGQVNQRLTLKDPIAGEDLIRDLESGAIRTSLPVVTDQVVEPASLEVRRYHSDGSEEVIGFVTETRHVEPEMGGYELDEGLVETDGVDADESADD